MPPIDFLTVSTRQPVAAVHSMSWVRIDDAAMDHPKILLLTDTQFRLWMRGLCYCQKHLTDGFIPDQAIKSMLGRAEHVKRLVDVKLWDVSEGGFRVHDYLHWNDGKDTVSGRKQRAKDRKQAWLDKQQGDEERVPIPVLERVPNASHNQTKPNQRKKEDDRRPIFRGSRFDLFQWQIDEWGRMLGPATVIDPFTWAQEKDRELSQSAQVVPKESHGWLTKLLETDAAKHGMSIGRASDIHAIQPLPRPRNCKHSPPCASEDVHTSRYIAEQRMSA